MREEGFVDATGMLRPCVYLLRHRGRVVYIGQSKRPLVRIYSHRNLWGRRRPKNLGPNICGVLFDEIWLRPCRVEELDALEGNLILKYKPIHNIKSGGYTTIPPEMQNLVQRIVARKSVKSDSELLVDRSVIDRMKINRRGF